jgi:hypothetical protein
MSNKIQMLDIMARSQLAGLVPFGHDENTS